MDSRPPKANFYYGSIYRTPFPDNCFDSALLTEVLEHLEEPANALQEAHRILKPSGCLLLSVPFFLFTHGALSTGRSTRAALAAEGSPDLGGGGRFDEEHAQKRRNMPGQFDFGPQRVCWMSQIVTDWMGDQGPRTNCRTTKTTMKMTVPM